MELWVRWATRAGHWDLNPEQAAFWAANGRVAHLFDYPEYRDDWDEAKYMAPEPEPADSWCVGLALLRLQRFCPCR